MGCVILANQRDHLLDLFLYLAEVLLISYYSWQIVSLRGGLPSFAKYIVLSKKKCNIDDDSKCVKLICTLVSGGKTLHFFLNQTLFNNLQYLTSLIILWPKEHMICNKRQIDSYHKEPMLKDSKRRALGQSRADFRIPCQFIDSRHKKYIPI